jgi:hypothetical protein
LKACLPITKSMGETITDPLELELGAIYFLREQMEPPLPREEREKIELCRAVRNKLAHNDFVPYDRVNEVYEL